jgi:pimeloyl-ACP methyl ester carboxylesterase
MQKVYFISGLGADERSFSFLDLSFCEPVFINWLEPKPKETLEAYAMRLKATITEPAPTIVGLSFGGMLATEIAKADSSARVIIISSNKTTTEFPFWLKIGKYFPIYNWLPDKTFTTTKLGIYWFMGAKTIAEKAAIKAIVSDAKVDFYKWAIGAILNWQNTTRPKNVFHIHGSADKTLPFFLTKSVDVRIKGGEHLMIMNKAAEISALLSKKISD